MQFIIAGILVGLGAPIQTAINTRLRRLLGRTFDASFVSFFVSLIFLLMLLPLTGQTFDIPFERVSREPPWIWLGGACGVTVLTGSILLFPRLGSMQTVVFPIAGQIIMGLTIDHFGFFDAAIIPITSARIIGAALVFVGVLLISSGRNQSMSAATMSNARLWLWRLFGVFIGTLTSVQTAVNSRLGLIIDAPVKAAVISFIVGVSLLTMICLADRVRARTVVGSSGETNTWWMWLGGLIGAAFVLTNVYLGHLIGTGLTIIVLLTGSMIGGLIVDRFGLLGAERRKISQRALIGIVVILSGIALIRL